MDIYYPSPSPISKLSGLLEVEPGANLEHPQLVALFYAPRSHNWLAYPFQWYIMICIYVCIYIYIWYGGFLKWGYPKSSFWIGIFSEMNHPARVFGVPPLMETPMVRLSTWLPLCRQDGMPEVQKAKGEMLGWYMGDIWRFLQMGGPIFSWMVYFMEKSIMTDDLGVPSGNLHM